MNVFVKPDEQSGARFNFAMARKRLNLFEPFVPFAPFAFLLFHHPLPAVFEIQPLGGWCREAAAGEVE